MDRSKKKGGGKGGGKQKASTSKGNGTRVEVHKHFDPILASRSFGENDFPEIVLAEKTSTRSANSAPAKVRKKLLPMPTDYYELQLFPNKRPVSCDRKEYRFLSSTSSASSYSPIRKKQSDEDRSKKKKSPTRDKDIPPKHKRVPQSNLSNPRIKETKTRHQPLQPPRPPIQDFDNTVIVYRDPLVEKIKAEIGMSAKFCNDEVKQTVAELKEEIAKYRRTLNRNVNFLQTKVKCGLGTEKMKENAVQTDPSGHLKDMNEFSALVTRIAELINIEDTKSDHKAPPPERPQQSFASIATGTPPLSRMDQGTQKVEKPVQKVEQQTETTSLVHTEDKSVENPKGSLEMLLVDKSVEFDYLEQQKENLTKVDELIGKAERSLQALKVEFYNNPDGYVAPSTLQCSEFCCYDEQIEQQELKTKISSTSGKRSSFTLDFLGCKEKPTVTYLDSGTQNEELILLDRGTSSVSVKDWMYKDVMVQSSLSSQEKCEEIVVPENTLNSLSLTLDKSSSKSDDIARISLESNVTKSIDCTENIFEKDEDLSSFLLMKSIAEQTDVPPDEESDCSCPLEVVAKEPEDEKSLDEMLNEISEDEIYNGNDAHLNTISERTEIDESDIFNAKNEPPQPPPKKELILKVQYMPQIDIRPPLTVHTLHQINIKPTGSWDMTAQRNQNVGYQEIMHRVEDKPKSKSATCQGNIYSSKMRKMSPPKLSFSQTVTMNLNHCDSDCNDSKEKKESDNERNDTKREIITGTDQVTYVNESFSQNSESSENGIAMLTGESDTASKLKTSKMDCICVQEPINPPINRSTSDDVNLTLKSKSVPIQKERSPKAIQRSSSECKPHCDVSDISSILSDRTSNEKWEESSEKDVKGKRVNSVDTPNSPHKLKKECDCAAAFKAIFSDDSQEKKQGKESVERRSLIIKHEKRVVFPENFDDSMCDEHKEESRSQSMERRGHLESRSMMTTPEQELMWSYKRYFNIKNPYVPRTYNVRTQTDKGDDGDGSKSMMLRTRTPDTCGLRTDKQSDESSENVSMYQLRYHNASTQVVPEDYPNYFDKHQTPCRSQKSSGPGRARVKSPKPKEARKVVSRKLVAVGTNHSDVSKLKTTETQTLSILDKSPTESIEEPQSPVQVKLHKTITSDHETKMKTFPCGDTISSKPGAEIYLQTTSEESVPTSCKRKTKKPLMVPSPNTSKSTSDDYRSPEESVSEGEIRCKCSVSIGELHLCRYAYDIKSRCANIRRHPERMLKPYDANTQVVKQKVYYDNWIAYYTSPGESPQNQGQSRDNGEL